MGQCESTDQSDLIAQSPPLNAKERNLRSPPAARKEHTTKGLKKMRLKMRKTDVPSAYLLASPSDHSTKTSPETPASSRFSSADDEHSENSESMLAQITSLTKSLSEQCFREEDDEDDNEEHLDALPEPSESLKVLMFVKSLSIREIIQTGATDEEDFDDDIIPEEVDPDAPSDEEDSFHRFSGSKENNEWENEPGPINILKQPVMSRQRSPPRPQSHIKLRNTKCTKPNSIVHRSPPMLSAKNLQVSANMPSPSSVDPHTLAQFNKLKVQVKLMKHQQRIKRHATKFEDRYEDVQNYRVLHKEFEDIQSIVSDQPQKLTRSQSFDLKDTNTWFYDFQSLDEDVDDDNSSVGSMSLLSAASMESQRRFFEAKFRARRRNSEPTISTSPYAASPSKAPKKLIFDRARDSPGIFAGSPTQLDSSEAKSMVSPRSKKLVKERTKGKVVPLENSNDILSTSRSILKHIKKEKVSHENVSVSEAESVDATDLQSVSSKKSPPSKLLRDESKRPTLPWPLQTHIDESRTRPAKTSFDNHVEDRDNTPTAGNRRRSHENTLQDRILGNGHISGFVDQHNYHVPRRRRQCNSSPYVVDIRRPSSPSESVRSGESSLSGLSFPMLPPSDSLDVSMSSSFHSTPRLDALPKEWVVAGNAEKCIALLNTVSSEFKSHEGAVVKNAAKTTNNMVVPKVDPDVLDPKLTEKKFTKNLKQDGVSQLVNIGTMNKEQFLRLSEEHSLARLSFENANYDNTILEARRLNFESVLGEGPRDDIFKAAAKQDQVVDIVSDQVNALLSRFRHEGDMEVE